MGGRWGRGVGTTSKVQHTYLEYLVAFHQLAETDVIRSLLYSVQNDHLEV